MTRSAAEVPARSRWRTGDLPGPLLLLGYLLVVASTLALASTGSWAGVVGLIVLMGLAAGTLYVWSGSSPRDT